MLLGYVADLHIRGEDYQYGSEALAEALDVMHREGVSRVVCAGDIFETPTITDKYAMTGTLVRAFLDPVDAYGLPWDLIEGNHDQAPASEKGALAALSASPLCRIISGDILLQTWEDGTRTAYLPWLDKATALAGEPSRDRKDHQEIFRQYSLQKIDRVKEFFSEGAGTKALIGHCEVLGAVGGAYRYVIPGSSFWFNCPELLETGADVIALGHIHYRQRLNLDGDRQWLGYIGSLRSMNFGERDYPSGFALHDTSTNDLRFVDLKKAPKYYVVSTSEAASPSFLQKVRPHDRVRVTGLTRPEGIPSSWDFVSTRTSLRQTSQPRGASLSPNASVMDVLAEWFQETGDPQSFDSVLPYAEKLVSEFEVPDVEGHGGIEEVCKITLEGIDRHPGTTIETEGRSRIAITGENGAGKSTLIGAVYACLYGDWPAEARGSLYDMMLGDQALLGVVFRAGGKTYRAQRILEKSGTKTEPPVALLLEVGDDGAEKAIAGPKVRLFEAKVEQLLGHKDIVLGSVFYTQDGTGDLVTSKKGARKDWIRRFLGLSRFDACAKAATERYKTAEKIILRAETTVNSIPVLEQEIRELLSKQKANVQKMSELKTELEGLEKERKKAQDGLDQARKVNSARDSLLRRKGLMGEEERRSREVLQRTSKALSNLRGQVPDGYSEGALRALAEECESQRVLVAGLQEARDKYEKVMRYHAKLQTEKTATEARLVDARKQASLLGSVGCRDNPLPCPLIANAVSAKAGIAEIKGMLTTLEEGISKCRRYPRPEGYTDALDRLRAIEGRLSNFSSVPSLLTNIEDLEKSYTEQSKAIQAFLREKAVLQEEIDNAPFTDESPFSSSLHLVTSQINSLKEGKYLQLRDGLMGIRALREKLAEQLESARGTKEKVASVREEYEAYKLLARAFGRDGIPQLLISHAVPEIQHYMDTICEEDFDSRYRVRFNTQKEHKNGVVEEAFEILFSSSDSEKEYDAASCSGGELAAVRVILRAALGLYQASRAQGHKVAFLDEFTAHQDAKNAESSLRVLSRLQERFSQVFFVTFDNLLLPSFPYRVMLSRNGEPRCQSL